MGVMANAKASLGGLWQRIKGWAHSVPPDVWIGLAIAAATLLVVWLAYRKAGSSSSSGLATDNPIIGDAGTAGTTPLTSQDASGLLSGSSSGTSSGTSSGPFGLPGVFDITKLWTGNVGDPGKPPAKITPGKVDLTKPSTLAQIIQSATTRDEGATASFIDKSNANTANVIAISPYVQSIAASVPDESTIAQAISISPTSNASLSTGYPVVNTAAAIPSATTRDESVVAKMIQAVKPQPKPAPAPIRPSPFATTPVPTGRGVNVAY